MANDNNKMDFLKKEAIRVYDGMVAVFPYTGEEETLHLSELAPKFPGCFAVNNSTVLIVSFDGEIFSAPFTRNLVQALHSNNFHQSFFYVPFSNGDCPKYEKAKWDELRRKAELAHEQDFVDDCVKFCDANGIGALSDETMKNCFEMPVSGIRVTHHSFQDCYFPVITSGCLDCFAIDNIGRYCSNNGKVVFVYRNGKTYVAKGYAIIKELQENGYTASGLFVPFSNGETIVDTYYRSVWENLKKN